MVKISRVKGTLQISMLSEFPGRLVVAAKLLETNLSEFLRRRQCFQNLTHVF